MRTKLGDSHGQIALMLLIGIIIFGAMLMVMGGPQFQFQPQGTEPAGEPIDNSPDLENSLQLNTLRFQPCESQLNIDFLLDRSGSMSNLTAAGISKITVLKNAVKAFTDNLKDESIIGIQSFNSTSIANDVPINLYKNVKDTIDPAVNALTPKGQTPTHDALAFSYQKLLAAKSQFPNKKMNFIFITDGLPVPISQDPTLFNPNPATQIKNLGVTVYTIGMHSPSDTINIDFSGLLGGIASKPSNYYEAPTGDELAKLLSQIKEKICNSVVPTPTTSSNPIIERPSPPPIDTPTPTSPNGQGPTPTPTPRSNPTPTPAPGLN